MTANRPARNGRLCVTTGWATHPRSRPAFVLAQVRERSTSSWPPRSSDTGSARRARAVGAHDRFRGKPITPVRTPGLSLSSNAPVGASENPASTGSCTRGEAGPTSTRRTLGWPATGPVAQLAKSTSLTEAGPTPPLVLAHVSGADASVWLPLPVGVTRPPARDGAGVAGSACKRSRVERDLPALRGCFGPSATRSEREPSAAGPAAARAGGTDLANLRDGPAMRFCRASVMLPVPRRATAGARGRSQSWSGVLVTG
jgi:hypothetical protein